MRHKLYNCVYVAHFSKSPFAGRQCGDHGKLMHNESVWNGGKRPRYYLCVWSRAGCSRAGGRWDVATNLRTNSSWWAAHSVGRARGTPVTSHQSAVSMGRYSVTGHMVNILHWVKHPLMRGVPALLTRAGNKRNFKLNNHGEGPSYY